MVRNTENVIKGSIGETLIEELFKELGFFVLQLGKEHTVNPLDQLENFIDSCGGKFNMEKLGREIKEISHVNVLPDFIIVHPTGKSCLLEVKFRRDALLVKKWGDYLVFDTYPEAHMIVINLNVSDDFSTYKGTPEELENLMSSRFHIWECSNNEEGENYSVTALNVWLKKDFDVSDKELIEKYELLVKKWLEEKNN